MQRTLGYGVEPASDDALKAVAQACREYLADVARGGVGPDPRNLYQEALLRYMGEQMPAVLARLQLAEGRKRPYRAA